MMRSKLVKFAFLFPLILTACGGREYSGTIAIPQQGAVVVQDSSGNSVALRSGPAKISVEGKGDFFDSELVLKVPGHGVNSGENKFKFKIPREAFLSNNTFSASAESLNQSVGLQSKVVKWIESSKTFNGKSSCEHSGFCCKTGLTYDGKFESRCGVWLNCPGRQDAEIQETVTKTQYIVDLTRPMSQEIQILGTFTSDPIESTDRTVLKTLSACH